jgi:hypothetical protein
MKNIMAKFHKEMETSKFPQESEQKVDPERKKRKVPKVKKVDEKKLEKRRRKIMLPKDEKLKKPKQSPNVLILDPKKHRQDSTMKKLFKVIVEVFYEYAAITKVNGMYYLRRNVTSGWLRVLWSIIMIILMSFAATLIFLLYRRYLDSPTRVTIAPSMSINSIPFPGVTVCHPQNIMEYKSRDFIRKR